MLKYISKLVLCSLTIFAVDVSLFAQNNDSNSLSNIGLFPKQESPELYTFKISGEYRFLGSYVGLDRLMVIIWRTLFLLVMIVSFLF